MKRALGTLLLLPALVSMPGWAQSASQSQLTLRLDTRAVLLDIIVTGKDGKPVQGLPRDAFSITEDGKSQRVQFFEEHNAAEQAKKATATEMPRLPENTFSNFSPYADPPAVTVLLLDSLNTQMENQSFVHKQALDFLSTAKPGDRMAIFTMGKGLHFIQGFNDDPTVLVAALKNKKNNEVENGGLMKTAMEGDGQQGLMRQMKEPITIDMGPMGSKQGTTASAGGIAAIMRSFNEADTAQASERIWLTLGNLQRLADYLEGFPGRKNIIWFAQKPPALFINGMSSTGAADIQSGNPGMDHEIKRTLSMLAASRAAIYPVQPQGLQAYGLYTAESNAAKSAWGAQQLLGAATAGAPDPINDPTRDPNSHDIPTSGAAHDSGGFANSMMSESMARNSDQFNAEYIAEQSGGKAYANTNALSRVMNEIAGASSDFYTLSYAPSNSRMNGAYRSIRVKVNGPYKISYRRGYFAMDEALPGGALNVRQEQLKKYAEKNGGVVDPLIPFMELGMPQNEQILYKAKLASASAPDSKTQYSIDFAVDLKDLKMLTAPDGMRTCKLSLSMIVYDRYGKVVTRKYHLLPVTITPDVYKVFEEAGVQLHGTIAVPKGNYWLRTGVYDWNSKKVGTMEIPLDAVKTMQASAEPKP